MAVTVGCRLPGRFDGAVSVAGWIPVRCAAAGISLLAVGGTEDDNLGAERARSMAATWRSSVASCAGRGDERRTGRATVTTWSECVGGAEVRLVELAGVGHVWPRFDDYDATVDVIEFARRLDGGSAG
jgi:poly(3-hydroxybutyrate) depolymerase